MPARKKSGFTLIELLVVIAIIAILAAILFPVFARAREAARKSTCQSNMKECAIALQTYWNDYDATLPSSYAASGGLTQSGFATFAGLHGVCSPDSANDHKSWVQMLYNNLKSKDITFCPSDATDHNDVTKNVSYIWKRAIDTAWTQLLCQKEGQFAYNSDDIVFFEAQGFHSGGTGLGNGAQINVAFLDTHVRSITLTSSSVTSTAAASPTNPNPLTATSGEPMYFNFNNDLPKSATNPDLGVASAYDPRVYSDMLP